MKSIAFIGLFLMSQFLIAQSSTIQLFEVIPASDNLIAIEGVEEYTLLRLSNLEATKSLLNDNNLTETINLQLPLDHKQIITLNLSPQTIFTKDFKVTEKGSYGERAYPIKPPSTYFGQVNNQEKSMAGFSFFEQGLAGVFAFEGTNYNLEYNSSTTQGDLYLLYKEQNITTPTLFSCETEEEIPLQENLVAGKNRTQLIQANNTVSVYLECDYALYQVRNNSTTDLTNFISGLFGVVAGLFSDAGVTIQMSELVIWTELDPYESAAQLGSAQLLDEFQCERIEGYNGRLAHLLTINRDFGGRANRRDCPTSGPYTKGLYGVSSISNSYSADLSVYSRSVLLLAHELGHQLSAPHTHACAWNGNNTPIDCCGALAGFPEANCNCNLPLPTSPGTILSYCRQGNGPGIDLSLGFHPQVAARMSDFASNCLSATIDIPCPTSSPTNMSVQILSPTSVNFQSSLNGNFFTWRWRQIGSNTWLRHTEGSFPADNYTATSLVAGVDYEFITATYCSSCSCWGDWSCKPVVFNTTNIEEVCPDDKTITDNPASGNYYAANELITGMNSPVEIVDTATFQAGNSITLQSGFHAQAGSNFTAIIGDCPMNFDHLEVTKQALINKNQIQILESTNDITLTVFPNPFVNSTNIQFNLPESSTIQVNLYNLNGQLVKKLLPSTFYEKGQHQFEVIMENLNPSVYFLSLQTTKERLTQKIILK